MARYARARREQRDALAKEAKGFLDLAEREKRSLTAEQEERIDKILTDCDRLEGEIRIEEDEAATTEKRSRVDALVAGLSRPSAPLPPDPVRPPSEDRQSQPNVMRDLLRRSGGWEHRFEVRQVQGDQLSKGGYLLQPDQFIAELIQDVYNEVFLRRISRVIPVARACNIGAPSLKTRLAAPTWVGELTTGDADSTLEFGRRNLHPHPLALKIYVSKTLLAANALNPETIVRDEIAYALGITQEDAYLNGNGQNKPLGVFTASTDGISTTRDVETASSGVMVADDIIELVGSLKEQYVRSATFVLHRGMKTRARKFKAGDGHYLWSPGVLAGGSLTQGMPESLEGRPIITSEYAPNTYTAGNYAMILGDFGKYWIVDALDMQIERLIELRAEYNQVEFILRYEGDAAPVREEAFSRLKLKA